jgi:hypothetical protein
MAGFTGQASYVRFDDASGAFKGYVGKAAGDNSVYLMSVGNDSVFIGTNNVTQLATTSTQVYTRVPFYVSDGVGALSSYGARLGILASSILGGAAFSNSNSSLTQETDFAIAQATDGTTYLNAPSDKPINIILGGDITSGHALAEFGGTVITFRRPATGTQLAQTVQPVAAASGAQAWDLSLGGVLYNSTVLTGTWTVTIAPASVVVGATSRVAFGVTASGTPTLVLNSTGSAITFKYLSTAAVFVTLAYPATLTAGYHVVTLDWVTTTVCHVSLN